MVFFLKVRSLGLPNQGFVIDLLSFMKLAKPIVIAQISKGSGKDSETYWGNTTLMNPWVLFISDEVLGSSLLSFRAFVCKNRLSSLAGRLRGLRQGSRRGCSWNAEAELRWTDKRFSNLGCWYLPVFCLNLYPLGYSNNLLWGSLLSTIASCMIPSLVSGIVFFEQNYAERHLFRRL